MKLRSLDFLDLSADRQRRVGDGFIFQSDSLTIIFL